jgi:transposase
MELDFSQEAPRISTLSEAQAIIEILWNKIATQEKEIEALKEKLNTNSNNSSKPPSSNMFNRKKKLSHKKQNKLKQGAQKDHKGSGRELLPVEEVNYIEHCALPKACECGGRIIPTNKHRRHQVHELPRVKAVVTEYQLSSGYCENCKRYHEARLPVGVPTGMLGPAAMAKIGVLTADYRLSKRNVTYLLDDFYGLKISVGTVYNTEQTLSKALENVVEEAKAFIPKQSMINADETGHTEKQAKMWTWVCIASLVAVFIIRASRGAKVIKEMIGENFTGTLCTDRWSAYAWMSATLRQLCWAHLLRDFKKISERSGISGKIGDNLLSNVYRMFHHWKKVKAGTLTRDTYRVLMEPVRKQIETLLAEGMACKHPKTSGMCKKILSVKEALWTFMEKEGVEPTNNLAEQVLRRIVIWRKTSFGTQSPKGTLYLERIMTVVATCKLQKRNVLNFMTQTLRAHLSNTCMPSLIPRCFQNADEVTFANTA